MEKKRDLREELFNLDGPSISVKFKAWNFMESYRIFNNLVEGFSVSGEGVSIRLAKDLVKIDVFVDETTYGFEICSWKRPLKDCYENIPLRYELSVLLSEL